MKGQRYILKTKKIEKGDRDMRHLSFMDINWDSIASVPKENLLIICGTILGVAVIVAICVILVHIFG